MAPQIPAAMSRSENVDLFLKLTANGAPVQGEAQDAAISIGGRGGSHAGEIQLSGWSWGVQTAQDRETGLATGARTHKNLRIYKGIDSASVVMFQALVQNSVIDAVLTARKAGGTQLEFVKIKLKRGRLASFDIEHGDLPTGTGGREVWEIAYHEVDFEYTPQRADGRGGGTIMASDTRAIGH